MLFSLLPTVATAAETAQNTQEQEKDATPHTPESFLALYVGADGSKTANGGKLNALWTAYTLDKGVSIANGVWIDKVNGEFASGPIQIERDTRPVS